MLSRLIVISLISGMTGCMSAYIKRVGEHKERISTGMYYTDLDTLWQAILNALKSKKIHISNKESGYIQTDWEEDTFKRYLVNNYGEGRTYIKSKSRFRINVSKGFSKGRTAIKVAIGQDQFIKKDAVEGWTKTLADQIEEKTILYRISKIIKIQKKIEEIERKKSERATKEEGI